MKTERVVGYRRTLIARHRALPVLLGSAAALLMGASSALALPITLTASDAINTSSFNAAGNWSNAAAPSAGNTYFTQNFTLRTPAAGTHVFAGDSLSLDAGGVLAFKTAGAITVGNLILNGGAINNFDVGGTQIATLNGAINLTAGSSIDSSVAGRTILVNSTIGGGAPLTLNGVTGITLAGNNNYTGATTVNVGTLTLTNASALGATGPGNETTIVGGNGTTARTLALGGGAAMNIAETLNFNGNAAGRSGLSANSAFNHTLSGPIDVTSATNIVQWSSNGAGSITVTGDITGNMTAGALLFLRGGSTSANNRILGSLNITGGNLAKTDTGTWVIGNAGETYSWANTQVSVGTLRTAIANMLPAAGTIIVGQNDNLSAVLDLAGNSQSTTGITYNYGGTATTSTGAITTGAGTLTLNGNLAYNTVGTYTGAGGSLSGLLSLGGGARTFTIGDGGGAVEMSVSANISNGSLVKAGAGTLRLSGNNSFGAGTFTYGANDTADLGALRLASANAMGNHTVLNLSGNNAAERRIELEGNINFNDYDILTNGRANAQTVGAALVNISGNNTWAGDLSINGTGGGYGIRSDAGLLTLNGNLLRPLSLNDTRNWDIGGAGNITSNGVANETGAQGIMGFTKFGAGNVTFTNANLYNGTTTINQGTFALTGSGAIDNSPTISIAAGANFNVTGVTGYDLVSGQSIIGDGNIVGNAITDAGSFISPGVGAGDIGILTFNGNLDIDGSLVIDFNPAAGGSADMIVVNGILDISGATLDLNLVAAPLDDTYIIADYDSLVGTFATVNVLDLPSNYEIQYNFMGQNQIALTAMPEPATMSLLALGGLAMLRRRRATR